MKERFNVLLPLGGDSILVQLVHARILSLLELLLIDVSVEVSDVGWHLTDEERFAKRDQLRS
jgi:hypothetical protein